MGNLKSFIKYLNDRINVISDCEKRLCGLQEKYETFFGEVNKVRESELGQLTEHILTDRASLPAWFDRALDKAEAEVEKELAEKLAKLEEQHRDLCGKAERLRVLSVGEEQKIRKKNVALDGEEERLKARNQKLLADIADYNDRIRQMGKGFGFFANFFKMRRMAKEKQELADAQADIASRIEGLRARWAGEEKEYTAKELDLQKQWIAQETEAAGVRTKIDYLQQARPRILLRSTVERVLFELVKETPEPDPKKDPQCPRCQTPNSRESHFCQICAQRLTDDRPDFEGSIREIAEINHHHGRFSDGMRACQEIIGLVRGLKTGLEAFMKSVKDVKHSQDRHKLSTLSINVPGASAEYGKQFDALRKTVAKTDLSLHPQVFAKRVEELAKQVFTEKHIKDYFERMGNELSARAHAQWD
jgi:hypothetical protein